MWSDYNKNGRSDFMCTNAVTYIIRDNAVHANVQMRSNDAVFGYKNDRAWQRHVLERLTADLNGRRKSVHDEEQRQARQLNTSNAKFREDFDLSGVPQGCFHPDTYMSNPIDVPISEFTPYAVGNLYWHATSLHIYSRHFKLVEPGWHEPTKEPA